VTLDGGSPVTVDLHSASVLWQQQVWSTGIPHERSPHGEDRVDRGRASSGYRHNTNVDALEVTGTLE